jgi:hypothetical protein
MAERKKGGITGAGGKYVDPFFNQPFPPSVSTYPPSNLSNLMDGPKWGAGDPDYIKKMIASSKSKPVKRK